MKKRILSALILLAVAVWAYNAGLLLGWPKRTAAKRTEVTAPVGTARAAFVYKADFPDPFYCAAFMRAPVTAAVEPGSRPRRSRAPVALPPCKIGGIVYNPENPMAIFIHGGKSDLVKQGDMVDSILIKKITPDSVTVVYRNSRFVLGK